MAAGKKYKKSLGTVNSETRYPLDQALDILEAFEKAKFDETVDVAILLGVDPKQGEQNVRGAVPLPHGTGKILRVAVFAKGEKAKEAEDAGADIVGADELAAKVLAGFMDFDCIIATPDMMGVVGKLGKVLGPRGLMPNPKLGTVTNDVVKAIKETKAGKVEFRIEKAALVHAPIGKRSFGKAKLKDNLVTLLSAIVKAKPAAAKGTYLQTLSISATMTPGVKVDTNSLPQL